MIVSYIPEFISDFSHHVSIISIIAMKQVAFVVAASELEDYKITEVIEELAKRDISADIVAFDEDTASPDWGKYDLILPTPSLDYTHQYERLLQVGGKRLYNFKYACRLNFIHSEIFIYFSVKFCM